MNCKSTATQHDDNDYFLWQLSVDLVKYGFNQIISFLKPIIKIQYHSATVSY